MRFYSMTGLWSEMKRGYMTVEAAVVFPLLIFAFAILMYLVLFVYNRAVLGNDTALVALYAAEEYHEDPETFLIETDKHFSLIKSERPYLSIGNLNMNITKEGNHLYVRSDADFYVPIRNALGNMYDVSDVSLEDKKEMTILNPSSIMLLSDDITRSFSAIGY